MRYNPGDRVFAILSADPDEVRLIGRGKYLGNLPFKDADPNTRGAFGISPADVAEECPDYTNPCLEMDDGVVVWGCECWWGPEERLDELLKGRKVVNINMIEERSRAKEK